VNFSVLFRGLYLLDRDFSPWRVSAMPSPYKLKLYIRSKISFNIDFFYKRQLSFLQALKVPDCYQYNDENF